MTGSGFGFFLRLKKDGSVYEDPAHEPAHLPHAGELGPLVEHGVVALHGAEDGLVLAEAAADVDATLMGHHGAPEPGLVHRRHARPLVRARAVTFN